jgi:hypothetical protein
MKSLRISEIASDPEANRSGNADAGYVRETITILEGVSCVSNLYYI